MAKSRKIKQADPIVLNRIAIVLKEERKSNRWLANNTEFTETTISQWVNNKKQPTLYSLYLISLLLERDIKDLVITTSLLDDKMRREQIKALKKLIETGKRVKPVKKHVPKK